MNPINFWMVGAGVLGTLVVGGAIFQTLQQREVGTVLASPAELSSQGSTTPSEEISTAAPIRPTRVELDALAPEFSLVDTDGKVVKLSDFMGKPVVLTFWATWCPNCNTEMPILQETYRSKNQQFVMLAIHRDPSVSPDKVAEHVKKRDWMFSHVLTQAKQNTPGVDSLQSVTSRYLVIGQPETYFIDAKGVVKEVHRGNMGQKTFVANLEQIGVN